MSDAKILKSGGTPRGSLIRNALRAAIEYIGDGDWEPEADIKLLGELQAALDAAMDL